MIKSSKDQGNQLFKNGKYSQAVKHYKLYVQQSHQDNKNAYFNLSLCYSKLGKHKESAEAAEKALSLDPNYTKCYYRLALEHKEIGNRDYQVFINASCFLRLAAKQQISEREQMKKLIIYYKSKLLNTKTNAKINNFDQIVSQTQALMTQTQFRIEVDKEITEWITEWSQNTQDQQAKLLEIRYIMEEIDYNYGLNVAYFYLNQITNPLQKAKIQNQINAMRYQLKRQNSYCIKQLLAQEQILQVEKIDEKDSSFGNDEDDQNLFQSDEKEQQSPKIFNNQTQQDQINESTEQKIKQQKKNYVSLDRQTPKINSQVKPVSTISTQSQGQNNIKVNSENVQNKTPKQRIQYLLKNKQKLEEYFGQKQTGIDNKNIKEDIVKTKVLQKTKNNNSCSGNCQHHHSHQPMSEAKAIQKRKSIVQSLKSAIPSYVEDESSKIDRTLPFKKLEQRKYHKQEQKEQTIGQIQEVYNSYCGWLANQKNKFISTYKSVLKILESTQISSMTKGELLVLLKKRIKNFIIIMRSNSQNQQKILYSLLTKHGIQQYANDITPLFYTP